MKPRSRGRRERGLRSVLRKRSHGDHSEMHESCDKWLRRIHGRRTLENRRLVPSRERDDERVSRLALCVPELAEDRAGRLRERARRPSPTGAGRAWGSPFFARPSSSSTAVEKRRVSLHVDVDNLTGAVRLYTRAGMTPDPRFVVWERKLNARGRP